MYSGMGKGLWSQGRHELMSFKQDYSSCQIVTRKIGPGLYETQKVLRSVLWWMAYTHFWHMIYLFSMISFTFPRSHAELSSVSLNTYLPFLFLPSSFPLTFVVCLLRVNNSYLLFELPRWTRSWEFSGVTGKWQCCNLEQNSKMEVYMKC